MDDLISRAAAIEAIGECPYNWNDWPEEIQAVDDYEFYKQAIENVPAVEAVFVVRCKDCKYGSSYRNAKGEDLIQCENSDNPVGDNCCFPMPYDWFCADGERRECE